MGVEKTLDVMGQSKNAQQDTMKVKWLICGGAGVIMIHMTTTMGAMAFSNRYASEVHTHLGTLVDNNGRALKTVAATVHTDAATVARQSDEKLASIESLVLPLGGETFIGQVAAVERSKTSMVVYFQANPLVNSFSIRLADNSKTIQKVDGQERGLWANKMHGYEDVGEIIMKGDFTDA